MKYVRHTYFWDGPFSQWSTSPFFLDGITFSTAEQYMMYKKASVFADTETAIKILDTDSPRIQKQLGREVKNFNVDVWESIARDVVLRASLAKFTQNEIHFNALMETAGTLLVEASPYDKVWGIGLDAEDAACTPSEEWPGKNWLGLALTETRDSLLFSAQQALTRP